MALLYPAFRKTTVVAGWMRSADQLSFALDTALQQLTQPAKEQALSRVSQIEQDTAEYFAAAKKSPNVSRVGDITLNPREGLALRASAIETQRDQLANLVNHYVHPDGARLADGGGMNGTWTT